MRVLVGALICAVVVGVVFIGAATGSTRRSMNCAGYCLYGSQVGAWAFDGEFHQRLPNVATSEKPWLRLSNTAAWKLTLGPTFSGRPVAAEIHLGTPQHRGALLAVLCTRCQSGAHGKLRLSDKDLAAIFAGKRLGASDPVAASIVLRTSTQNLAYQLRDS